MNVRQSVCAVLCVCVSSEHGSFVCDVTAVKLTVWLVWWCVGLCFRTNTKWWVYAARRCRRQPCAS